MNHDRETDLLIALVGNEAEGRDLRGTRDERLLNWIAADLRLSQTSTERAHDDIAAELFASRVRARVGAERTLRVMPLRTPATRTARVRATVAQSVQAAAASRCAPLLDLAAAAGAGRALWDEACDAWLEIPDEIPPSRHVAIRVAGDSMLPVLKPRDIILVKLDATPSSGDLVVARLDDDGYVVKYFERSERGDIELLSFNTAYAPLKASQRHITVLGTVIARFSTGAQAPA